LVIFASTSACGRDRLLDDDLLRDGHRVHLLALADQRARHELHVEHVVVVRRLGCPRTSARTAPTRRPRPRTANGAENTAEERERVAEDVAELAGDRLEGREQRGVVRTLISSVHGYSSRAGPSWRARLQRRIGQEADLGHAGRPQRDQDINDPIEGNVLVALNEGDPILLELGVVAELRPESPGRSASATVPRNTPAASIEIVESRNCSSATALPTAFGMRDLHRRLRPISGVETMKMIRRHNITSTSGVTLMPRPGRPRPLTRRREDERTSSGLRRSAA
jgi:hypothetical protein